MNETMWDTVKQAANEYAVVRDVYLIASLDPEIAEDDVVAMGRVLEHFAVKHRAAIRAYALGRQSAGAR